MLPEALAGGLCSLVEGKHRLAVSVVVEIDEEQRVTKSRVVSSVIRSTASLSYPEAARLMGQRGAGAPAALSLLDRVARALRRRRLDGGVLARDLPEVRGRLDGRGSPMAFAV